MATRLLLSLLAPMLVSATAGADVLCLKDGRIVEGRPLARTAGGVKIAYEAGEVFVPDALVLDCLIDGEEEVFEPRDEDERQKLEKGYVRFDGRWMSTHQRDRLLAERLEERRALAQEMKTHGLWRNRRKEQTKHFEFEHTLPNHVFEDYRDRMEAYFTAFAKDWRVKPQKKKPRLRVCFYGDREAFHQVSGAGRYTLGYFRYVEPVELNIFYDRLDHVATEEIMFHEANHYLQSLIDPEFAFPHFPGESLAEYYGSSTWDPERKELKVGLVLEGRLTSIHSEIDAGTRVGLRELIVDKSYEHYTWGWSLVHFVMNDKRYAKKFRKFIVALPSARDVERTPPDSLGFKRMEPSAVWDAFCKYLDLEDEDEQIAFEREWHHYVEEVLQVESVHGLEKAGLRALRDDRPIRARRLLAEAVEAGSSHPLVYHKYGELLVDEKEYDDAVTQLRKAVELDPLTPDFYATLGYALKKTGKKRDGEKMLDLAREIDPDNPFVVVIGGD